jgi:hypothetical protein
VTPYPPDRTAPKPPPRLRHALRCFSNGRCMRAVALAKVYQRTGTTLSQKKANFQKKSKYNIRQTLPSLVRNISINERLQRDGSAHIPVARACRAVNNLLDLTSELHRQGETHSLKRMTETHPGPLDLHPSKLKSLTGMFSLNACAI